MPNTVQDQTLSKQTRTQSVAQDPKIPVPNLKKSLLPIIIIAVIALVVVGAFYVKNLKIVLERIEKPLETSQAEYLRLDFSLENGQLKFVKAADIDGHPTAQPSKPEDGYEITIVSSGQTTYQAFLHKTQEPLFVVIPTEGDEIVIKETKSGSQIMTLNLTDIKKSASIERNYANPQINIFTASWKMTVADIQSLFFKVRQQESESGRQAGALSQSGQAVKSQITKTDKTEGDLTTDYPEFTVDYLISNDRYIVTIKQNPFSEMKKKAENWFISQGFSQQDLCVLKISFYPAKGIEISNEDDTKPSGC